MAVIRNIAKPMTREEDRVGSVTIDTPPSGGWSVHARRVVIGKANDGAVLAERGGAQITRSSATAAGETATLASGEIIRLVDIIEALDVLADRWAAEDAARAEEGRNRPEPSPESPARVPVSPLQGVGRP